MRKILTALFTLSLAVAAWSQSESARGLIRDGRADGLIVEVVNAQTQSVEPFGRRYRAGDAIRVSLTPSLDGYIYLINVSPQGERRLMFPLRSEDNRVVRGQHRLFPGASDSPLVFDNVPGVESLEIVLSRQTIPRLEMARHGETLLAKTSEAGYPSNWMPPQQVATTGFTTVGGFRGIQRGDGVTWEPNSLPSDATVRVLLRLAHD